MIIKKLISNFLAFQVKSFKLGSLRCSHNLVSGFHKVSTHNTNIFLIPLFEDNYSYIIQDKVSNKIACIDPGDGNKIVKALNDLKFKRLNSIFCTHYHADHIGGNIILKNKFPSVNILGPKYEKIDHVTESLEDGTQHKFGSLLFNVIYTPCHTKGHISYLINSFDANDDHQDCPILFSGDTLFVGGCGKFFEGTAEDMQNNMEKYRKLPPNTLVFCGHEYTEKNFKFLASIDPETCAEEYSRVISLRKLGLPTIPSTIEKEMKYNLFMKCSEERVQKLLNAKDSIEAMSILRQLKNDF